MQTINGNGIDLSMNNVSESPVVEHIVRLAKDAGRQLDDAKSQAQIQEIMDQSLTAERKKRGWSLEFVEPLASRRFNMSGSPDRGYTYTVLVRAICRPSRVRTSLGMEFQNLVASMDQKAQLPKNRWRVADVDDAPYVPMAVEAITLDAAEELGYAPFEMPQDWNKWLSENRDGTGAFDHLYGLDDYIAIIKRTIEAAVMSGWQKRINIALIGPPACGKSDLIKTLVRLVGKESVLEFDGTSTTMAGAQQDLAEREELPRLLAIEEIEKADPGSLSWLLSVLDLRGEVRKTTARGSILKEVHMVGICTVNNEELFEKIASGALASRFALVLDFRRPTREILWQILNREVRQIGGDESWIEPALDYAEEIGTTDPRRIIAIMLSGREELVSGRYQEMLRRVRKPREATEGTGAR